MGKRKGNKQTPNQREYAKQLQRIKNAVKRAEKRGYIFNENVIPQTPKRITKSAIQKLKETTTNKLYGEATYVEPLTGEVFTGLEGRKIERYRSAKKAQQTRQRNKAKHSTAYDTYYPDGGEIIYSNVFEDFISRLGTPTTKIVEDFIHKMRDENSDFSTEFRNTFGDVGEEFYNDMLSLSEDSETEVDWFISELNKPTEEYGYNYYTGKKYKRLLEAIQESERSKNTLLTLTYRAIDLVGKSALGWRLNARKDEVHYLVTQGLYDSKAENIRSACTELASIINGALLTQQEVYEIGEQEEYNESWTPPI